MSRFYEFTNLTPFSISKLSPTPRKGFRNTREPVTVDPCAGDTKGRVKTTYKKGATIKVTWDITIPHGGKCFIDLSSTGMDTSFETIKTIDNCGDNVVKKLTALVKLP